MLPLYMLKLYPLCYNEIHSHVKTETSNGFSLLIIARAVLMMRRGCPCTPSPNSPKVPDSEMQVLLHHPDHTLAVVASLIPKHQQACKTGCTSTDASYEDQTKKVLVFLHVKVALPQNSNLYH